MNVDKYERAVIEHLRSGKASDAVWNEVAQHLAAESECAPLLLDVELGFAAPCECGVLVWKEGVCCEVCGRALLKTNDVAS